MNRMTFNLIMVAKNAHFGIAKEFVTGNTPIDRIKSYVSHVCDIPIDMIKPTQLRLIFMAALCDYMDTCDYPSEVMREMDRYGILRSSKCEHCKESEPNNVYNGYASLFMMVRVKDINERGKKRYVNGFRKDFFKEWKDEYEW